MLDLHGHGSCKCCAAEWRKCGQTAHPAYVSPVCRRWWLATRVSLMNTRWYAHHCHTCSPQRLEKTMFGSTMKKKVLKASLACLWAVRSSSSMIYHLRAKMFLSCPELMLGMWWWIVHSQQQLHPAAFHAFAFEVL